MPRISPVDQNVSPEIKTAFERHVREYRGRITNMKATLGHSLTAFESYMSWYPLYEEVKTILGERLAYLFAFSISQASNCPLCSTYFRKIIIDRGERPEALTISGEEQEVLDFGAAIAEKQGHISDGIYEAVAKRFAPKEMLVLIAFAGQMIATNILNNVIGTDIDDYLQEYLEPKQYKIHDR